jgi:integrase
MPRAKRAQNTGSISARPRSDGRFEARLTLPDGSRRSFYGKTWREAEAKLTRARRDLEVGHLPADGRVTVNDLWEEYVRADPGNLRRSTMRPRENAWRNHIAPIIGRVKLSQLSPAHVQRVVTHAREAGLAPSTVHSIHRTLKIVLSQGVRWEMLPTNPAAQVSVPRGFSREMPLETNDQVSALLRALRASDLSCAFVLAVGLGLRSGEVRGLRWQDVDLDAGLVRVRNGLDIIEGEVQFVPLKTRSSRRDLPIPAFVAAELRAQRIRQAEMRLRSSRWEPHDLVVSARSGRPVAITTCLLHLRRACDEAGVPHLTFHHLRHLCATILLTQGVAPRVAQDILGHSSIDTTMRIYAHVNRELLATAAASMNDAFDRLTRASGS